ncbi:MAG TPA: acyl-CoA dehydrogenase family protein [Alphaproteobacteria bacterium]
MSSAAAEPLEQARRLRPLLAAAASRIEAERRIPDDVLSALHDAGLFRVLMPRGLGGLELEPALFVQVTEAIAEGDASTAWCLCQACGSSMAAAYLEPAVAREIFKPRVSIAWGPGAGRAVPVDGGYRVSGTWSFASGGRHASWLGARCQLLDSGGTPRTDAAGKIVHHTMLFPASAAEWADTWRTIGLRGTASDTYSVNDVFVPEKHSFTTDYTLSPDDTTKRYLSDRLYCFPAQSIFAPGFAGVALGTARAVLDAFIATAREKTPRASTQQLRDDPIVQLRFGEAETRLRRARVFLLQTLREAWANVAPPEVLSLDQRVAIRMAATGALHEARDAVDMVYHLAGATAIFDAQPFERRFRDIHSVVQQIQGRQQHFATIGRHLFGLEVDKTYI